MTCVICLKLKLLPHVICEQKHYMCMSCTNQSEVCPICKTSLTSEVKARYFNIRKVKTPCQYYKFGCSAIIKLSKQSRHERKCLFRPYECPFCGIQCHREYKEHRQVLSHMIANHDISIFMGNDIIINTDGSHTGMLITMMCFMLNYFMINIDNVSVGQNHIYSVLAQIFGTEADAAKYKMRVTFKKDGKRIKKVQTRIASIRQKFPHNLVNYMQAAHCTTANGTIEMTVELSRR